MEHILIGQQEAKSRHTHNLFMYQNPAISCHRQLLAPVIPFVNIAKQILTHFQTYNATDLPLR